MAMSVIELRSRTPRYRPAPSSRVAKRKSVFRNTLLQSLARGSDAREAVTPLIIARLGFRP
jgi:hypothetical protein